MAGTTKKRGSGAVASIITLVLIAAVIFGWAKVNNIQSFSDAYKYFKSWSDYAWGCGAGELEWNCDSPGSGETNGGGSENDSDSKGDSPQQPTEPGTETPADSKDALTAKLDSITLKNADENAVYTPKEWKHWVGSPCDTREEVLKASGSDVVTDPKNCKIISGKWIEPYGKKTVTDSSKLDIDHIVPKSWAARNGGHKLSLEQKQAFANDFEGLSISDYSENRSKGDKGPSEYLPPNDEFKCEYVTRFVNMVVKYDLTMPENDANAIRGVIKNNCG